MGFRTKLILSYIFLIALITGNFYLFFDHSLQKRMFEESRANLISQTQLARLLVMNDRPVKSPQQLAKSIGTVIKARVTLITPDGTVIGDSDVEAAQLKELENHLQRPEVQEALKGGVGSTLRYSETLRTTMLYSAMSYDSGTTVGFIRLALPLEYLTSVRDALHRIIAGAIVVTILIALLFAYLLSNVTSRPLRDMAAAAARIGQGGKTKIPVRSNDEIGMLATVLNDMSERIEDQVQNLSAEKQRLDTILSSMGEGIMVTASDGVITLINPAFRRLFSLTGNIEGKRVVEISRHPDLLEAFNDLGKPDVNELVREIAIHTNNITLFTHWVPLNVDGVRQGIVAVFHDISDLKKAENIFCQNCMTLQIWMNTIY